MASYKQFKHSPITLPDLTADTDPLTGIRLYDTPAGKLPSVTTVLSDGKQDSIAKWKERVGEEQAKIIQGRASIRGTKIHAMCENYIGNNLDTYNDPCSFTDMLSFKQLQKIIDEHIDNVRGQEIALYSDYLKVAGRVDLIADFDGRPAIVDFKTSVWHKDKSWIESYFMQASAYAVMMEERAGLKIGKIVIIIAVDDNKPQLFVEKRDNYIGRFIEERQKYREKYGV